MVIVCLDASATRPSWMKDECFDVSFRPFHTNAFKVTETIEEEAKGGTLYISSPEQAFLECLLLAPKYYDYERKQPSKV